MDNKELIIRINARNDTIETVEKDLDSQAISFKKIDPKEFVEAVNEVYEKHYLTTQKNSKNLKLLSDEIIAMNDRYIVIKQPERKRVVTYFPPQTNNNKTTDLKFYNITFPNSIYIVEHSHFKKIISIECYSYDEFLGEKTKLYEYPMPNELSMNKMCIGSVSRAIENQDVIEALNRIIFSPYSHHTFSGVAGFSETSNYFDYLEKIEVGQFPYNRLRFLNKTLYDVM